MAGFVQGLGAVGSSSSTTTLVLTITASVPVGDYVILVFTANGSSATWSCADSGSNTYAMDIQESATTPFTAIFSAKVTTALTSGVSTITVTTTSQGGRALTAAQYTGLIAASPKDQTNQNNNATNTTATITASSANGQAYELVIGGFGMGGATTANAASGYTLRAKGASTGTVREAVRFDKIVGAVETSSCVQTWTTSVVSSGVIATYKLLNPPMPRIGTAGGRQAINRGASY